MSDFVRKSACCLIFALALAGLSTQGAAQETLRRIFILHSYEMGHICGQPQHDGVLAALADNGFMAGKNIILQTYYMDTKRKNNTPQRIAREAERALKRVREFHPDILVTLDDNAFRGVALKLVDQPLAIVFSGMNGQPEEYNREQRFMISRQHPGHNITGVYEKLHIADAVRIQKKILPDLRKIRMLSDYSPTGRALTRQVRIELAQSPLPIAFDIHPVRNWEEYRQEILAINKSADIGTIYPVALLLKDRNGKTYTAPEILRWTIAHCTKPAIALNYAFTSLGLFGGAAVDFRAMGYQSGEIVARILQGEQPGAIAIEEAKRYALVFNLNRIKQLKIDIPEDILLAADEVISTGGPPPNICEKP